MCHEPRPFHQPFGGGGGGGDSGPSKFLNEIFGNESILGHFTC
jgi:hypothetical protein